MANLFLDLPLPVMNGPGAAVDTSAMGGPKTVSVVGEFPGCTIAVEVSTDGGTVFAPLTSYQNQGGQTPRVFDVAASHMRINVQGRKNSVPFSANADVGANDGGGVFVTLALPAGNGAGAPVDISALGTRMTFVAGGMFPGATVAVEISEDGTAYAPLVAFAGQGGIAMAITTANWARTNVQGRKTSLPFTATLSAGALNDSSGGGGGGGSGSSCLIFRPGSGETGPVVFDDFDELYAQLEALRADANDDGCYTIMFDDSIVTPAVVPGEAYDMTNVTWEGTNLSTDVELSEDCVLTGLRRITNYLRVTNVGDTTPISDVAANANEAFYLGPYCALRATGGAGTNPVIDYATAGFDFELHLDDSASLQSGTHSCVDITAAATQLRLRMVGPNASVDTDSLGGDADTTFVITIESSGVQFISTRHTDFAGTLTIENDTNVRYDIGDVLTEDDDADPNQVVRVDPSAAVAPIVITLPEIAADNWIAGRPIIIKNVTGSANPIEVTPQGADTIDGTAGALTMTTPLGCLHLVSDGVSNWIIVKAVSGGDIYQPPEQWAVNGTIAAGLVEDEMSAQVSTSFDEWQALVDGQVVGLATRFTDAIVAGTATFEILVNGVVTAGLSLVCDSGTNPTGGIAAGAVPYSAGDLISVAITTSEDPDFAPTANNVEAQIRVQDT